MLLLRFRLVSRAHGYLPRLSPDLTGGGNQAALSDPAPSSVRESSRLEVEMVYFAYPRAQTPAPGAPGALGLRRSRRLGSSWGRGGAESGEGAWSQATPRPDPGTRMNFQPSLAKEDPPPTPESTDADYGHDPGLLGHPRGNRGVHRGGWDGGGREGEEMLRSWGPVHPESFSPRLVAAEPLPSTPPSQVGV